MADSIPAKILSTPSPIDSPILSASPSSSFDVTPSMSPSIGTASTRSFSNESSITSYSSRSSSRSCSLPGATSRRRGYIRPQGATFAPSAQSRDSVLSLGSIAHLQYYFARTGLLDGKGGQLAKQKQNGEYDLPVPSRFSLRRAGSDASSTVTESPIEEEGALLWDAAQEYGEDVMLPPTVSTYTTRGHSVPPPPDHKSLKKDLVDALENALHALEATASSTPPQEKEDGTQDDGQGFYEIQGLHILDTTTLAIRAARLYYTMHPNPTVLNSIKSDLQIRRELMAVLDVLKKWAARKFAGGLREDERLAILVWVSDVGMMIDSEAKLEEAERQERQGWKWTDEALWNGKTQERELSFLQSLLQASPADRPDPQLPAWQEVDTTNPTTPTPLLLSLSDGKLLVKMHNTAVKRSKRNFGDIKTSHADVAKPYRRADNLRFWLKAAEIRWELKLTTVDVMPVANLSSDPAVWQRFEDAVFRWSKTVREEITRDWKTEEDRKLHARAKSLALASAASDGRSEKIKRSTDGSRLMGDDETTAQGTTDTTTDDETNEATQL